MDELQPCGACRRLRPIELFSLNPRSVPITLYKECNPCKASKSRWCKSSTGKNFFAERRKDPSYKELNRKLAAAPHRVEKQRLAAKRLEDSGRYKERRKKWRLSTNGKKNSKVQEKKRLKRIQENPAVRLAWNMRVRLYSLLKGRLQSSNTLFSNSEFDDVDGVVSHFSSLLQPGMTLENYGPVWHVDHRIPVCMYDHSNQNDVMRCWSKANLIPMFGEENVHKSWKIVDSIALEVGSANWPTAWGGVLPSQAEKDVLYKRVRGSK